MKRGFMAVVIMFSGYGSDWNSSFTVTGGPSVLANISATAKICMCACTDSGVNIHTVGRCTTTYCMYIQLIHHAAKVYMGGEHN